MAEVLANHRYFVLFSPENAFNVSRQFKQNELKAVPVRNHQLQKFWRLERNGRDMYSIFVPKENVPTIKAAIEIQAKAEFITELDERLGVPFTEVFQMAETLSDDQKMLKKILDILFEMKYVKEGNKGKDFLPLPIAEDFISLSFNVFKTKYKARSVLIGYDISSFSGFGEVAFLLIKQALQKLANS